MAATSSTTRIELAIRNLSSRPGSDLPQLLLRPEEGRSLRSYEAGRLGSKSPLFSGLNQSHYRSYIRDLCHAEGRARWKLLKGEVRLTAGAISLMIPQKLARQAMGEGVPELLFRPADLSFEAERLFGSSSPFAPVQLENVVDKKTGERSVRLFQVALRGASLADLLTSQSRAISHQSFSQGFLFDLLFLPSNGGSASFQVDNKGRIVATVPLELFSDRCHSIRFLLAQLMELPFHLDERERLLGIEIDTLFIDWATSLTEPPPFATLNRVYMTLKRVRRLLSDGEPTHWELLKEIDPSLHDFYRNLTLKYPERPLEAEAELPNVSRSEKRLVPAWSVRALLKEALIANQIDLFKRLVARDGALRRTPLHIAALQGHLPVVRELLKEGSDPLLTDEEGKSALHLAIYPQPNLEIVQLIFEQVPPERRQALLDLGDSDGKTPLHLAVWQKDPLLVNYLIQVGSNVNQLSLRGYTPLHWAAKHGFTESSRLLLAAGARADLLNENQDSPLDLALRHGADEVVRLLIAPLFADEPALLEELLAIEKRSQSHLKRREYRLAARELRAAFPIAKEGYRPLLERQLSRIEELFLFEQFGITSPPSQANRAQRVAMQGSAQGCKELLKLLFQESLSPFGEPPTKYALIALDALSREELLPSSKVRVALLVGKADSLRFFQNVAELIEIKIAALAPFPAEVAVVELPKAAALELMRPQHTSLLLGSKRLHSSCKRELARLPYKEEGLSSLRSALKAWRRLQERANLRREELDLERDLQEPLDSALRALLLYFGRGQLTTRLGIEQLPFHRRTGRVLLEALESTDRIALHHLLFSLYRTLSQFIDDPRPNLVTRIKLTLSPEEPSIHRAAKRGEVSTTQELLQNGAPLDVVDSEGRSALHQAVVYGQVETVALLLRQFGKTIPLTKDRETPLHLAASIGDLEIATLLLNHYPFDRLINLRDRSGETALHRAARNGYLEITELLLKRGGDSALVDRGLRAPFDIALRMGHNSVATLLLFQERRALREMGYSEGELYRTFNEAVERGELHEQILSLTKLSSIYLDKRDYQRAALLLNSADAVAQKGPFPLVCRQTLLKRLEKIERRFVRDRIITSREYRGRIDDYRKRLHQIRRVVAAFLNRGQPVDQILEMLTQSYKAFLWELLTDSIQVAGKPPSTSFAMVGLGSIGRGEICPYSDAEFFFLLKEDNEESRAYFRLVTELIALKITNLGESEFKIIRRKDGEESLVPAGFSMDIGGLSPLGKVRGEEVIYELIATPAQLAQFQTEDWLRDHDSEIILVNAMRAVSYIGGDASLLIAYEEEVRAVLDQTMSSSSSHSSTTKLRQVRALELMRGFVEEFEPKLDQKKVELRAFDVKRELYRLPQMVISALALYHGLASSGTLQQIDELERYGVISSSGAKQLTKTIKGILLLRVKAHQNYKKECELLYHPRGASDEGAEGLFLITPEVNKEIVEVYRTLLPLHRVAKTFLDGDRGAFAAASFCDEAVGKYDDLQRQTLQFDTALESAEMRLALRPNTLSAQWQFAHLQNDLGQAREAAEHFEEALMILREMYGDQPHPAIASLLNNLGLSYQELGDFNRAIESYNSSLSMTKAIYGETCRLEIATILNNLGITYGILENRDQAINCFKSALSIIQEFYRDQPSVHLARLFRNLGGIYRDLGDPTQAIDYFNSSLSIYQKVHEGRLHPDIPEMLTNLGNGYIDLGDYHRAIDSFNTALSMFQEIFKGRPHPQIALTWNSLGGAHANLNEFDQAIDCFSTSLAITKEIHGDQPHPDIGSGLMNLGSTYRNSGDVSMAIHYLNSSLSTYRDVYKGRPHLDIALNLHNLGIAYLALGDLPQATDHFKTSLSIKREIYKESPHLSLAKTLDSLAGACCEVGNLEEGIAYYRELILIYRKIDCESCRHDLAMAYHYLGAAYVQSNRLDEAEAAFSSCLELRRELHLDQPHRDIAETLNNLGTVYKRSENIGKAIEYYGLSLSMYENVYGEKPHQDLVDNLRNIGLAHLASDSPAEAVQFFRRALSIKEQLEGGSSQIDYAIIWSSLASAYKRIGEPEEAFQCFEASLAAYKQVGRAPNPDEATTLMNFGALCQDLGRLDLAIEHFSHAFIVRHALYGDKANSLMIATMSELGEVHYAAGNFELAIKYYNSLIHMTHELYGPIITPDVAKYYDKLGGAHRALGDLEMALASLKRSYQIRLQFYKGFQIEMVVTVTHLGFVSQEMGEFSEAIDYFKASLLIYEKFTPNEPTSQKARLLSLLAGALEAAGLFDEAIENYNNSYDIFSQTVGYEDPRTKAAEANLTRLAQFLC